MATGNRPRSPIVFFVAFILIVSIFFAWTYATSIGSRLDYDARMDHFVDIDGDGLTDAYGEDVHSQSGDPNTVVFYRNVGNGNLQVVKQWHVPGDLHQIFAMDIDNDHHMEFIIDSYKYDSFFLVTFKDWKFEVQERPGGSGWADWLQFCDVNGDGRMELLTRSGLWTLANGSLAEIPMDHISDNTMVADLDGDGQDELFNEWTKYNSGRNQTLGLNVLAYQNGTMKTVFETEAVVQNYNEFRAIKPTTSIVFGPDRTMLRRTVLLLNETIVSGDADPPMAWNSTLRYTLFNADTLSWNGSYVIGPATILEFDSDATHYWTKAVDLNRDGFPDLIGRSDVHTIKVATSDFQSGNLSYHDASFAIEVESEIRIYCQDLDKDGADEIAVLNPTLGKVMVLFNDGRGAFSRRSVLDFEPLSNIPYIPWEEERPTRLYFDDMDRDGSTDIIVDQTIRATSFSIFYGDGKGKFPDSLSFTYNAVGGSSSGGEDALFDCSVQLNGDGKPDVVFGESHTYVLLNDGRGRFPDGMAVPLFFSIFLGAGAFVVMAYPLARRNKPAWAGLQRDQLVNARFYNILGWMAVMAGFVAWLALGIQFTDGNTMLLAFFLYYPMVLLVWGIASIRRVGPKASAAISLGAGWVMFLFGAFIALQYSSDLMAAPNLDHLMFLTGAIAALTVLFVALSVWALRHLLGIISGWTERISLPVPAELVEFMHTGGMKRHHVAWFGWAYSTGGGSGELLTVTRKTGFSATLVTDSGGVVGSMDPAKLIAELSDKMKERDSIKDNRSPDEVRNALEAAKEKGDAGRLLGGDPQHAVALTALFLALGVGAFFEITRVSLPTYWPVLFSPFIALAAFIATLLVVGPAASTRVHKNAVDVREWLMSRRIWMSDIKRIVPQKRFLSARLGPFYDAVHPSYYIVETLDGKHFHISGESAFLLRQALGSAWGSVFDPAQYREFFGRKLARGRLWAPSGMIGAAFIGLFMGWFLYGIFMFVMLMWTQIGNPWLDMFLSIVIPAVAGTMMLRLLIDSHARRIVETKAAMAARGPDDPVFGTGRRARRFSSAAAIAVAGELPTAIPSRRRVMSIGAARGSLALSIGILMLIPLANIAPPQGLAPEDNFHNDVFMQVKDSQTISAMTMDVNGDIVVNGSLTLKDCDIRMSGTFMVAGNLTFDHCRLSCPVGPGLYSCNAGDSSLLLSLDLRGARHAVLTFNERYQMTAHAKIGLWNGQHRLWAVTGTSLLWKNASVDISGLCGQAVYLRFAPSSWSESSHFDMSALTIVTDRDSESLTYPDITANGWDADQVSQGSVGIEATKGSVKISDSELMINGTWQGGIIVDRGEVLMTRTNLSSNGGLKATDSRLSVEDSTLNFTWADGFDLVNVTGTIKNNDISSHKPFILQPVAGNPCRLADSLVISGNSIHSPYSGTCSGPAFEIDSSLPVVDAMELTRNNITGFEGIYTTRMFISPSIVRSNGELTNGDIWVCGSWDQHFLDKDLRELSTGHEDSGWERVGSIYHSFYSGTYAFWGMDAEVCTMTDAGFQRNIRNGTLRSFMAEENDGLGYASVDTSSLARVDERLAVTITLANVCDAFFDDSHMYYDMDRGFLDIRYDLGIWGNAGPVLVSLSMNDLILFEDSFSYLSGSGTFEVPVDELAAGNLTLAIIPSGAPDANISNNERSWTIMRFTGSTTLLNGTVLADLCILDNASVEFTGCELEAADWTFMIGRNGASRLDIVNCSIALGILIMNGNISGSVRGSSFTLSSGNDEHPFSYISFGTGNFSLDGVEFTNTGEDPQDSIMELGGTNISVANSSFTRIGTYIIGARMENDSFEDCSYSSIYPNRSLTDCTFDNTIVGITVEDPNCTLRNNTFSANTTVGISGPVNISRFASDNLFLNLSGDYVYYTKEITIIVNDSWTSDLTSEGVGSIIVNYTSLFGSDEIWAYHDPEWKGVNETRVGPLYVTIGILNSSGMSRIFEISYNMTIITIYDKEIPYSGKIGFEDGSGLEVVLR